MLLGIRSFRTINVARNQSEIKQFSARNARKCLCDWNARHVGGRKRSDGDRRQMSSRREMSPGQCRAVEREVVFIFSRWKILRLVLDCFSLTFVSVRTRRQKKAFCQHSIVILFLLLAVRTVSLFTTHQTTHQSKAAMPCRDNH